MQKYFHMFINSLSRTLRQIYLALYKLYTKIRFHFNKQMTIDTMYAPFLEERKTKLTILEKEYTQQKNEKKALTQRIQATEKEVQSLKEKITVLQDLLFQRKP